MTETKVFNGKRYKAHGEYWSKKQVNDANDKMRKKGYCVRTTKGSYIGSYTTWIRKCRYDIRGRYIQQ